MFWYRLFVGVLFDLFVWVLFVIWFGLLDVWLVIKFVSYALFALMLICRLLVIVCCLLSV